MRQARDRPAGLDSPWSRGARDRLAALGASGPGGAEEESGGRDLDPPVVSRLLIPLLPAAAGLVAGLLAGSPVAALIVAGYAVLGGRLWRGHRLGRSATRQRADSLDLIGAAAAELRAGAVGGVGGVLLLPDAELDRLVHAARRLADGTGAPLAELLERLEAQSRAADRADAAAAAQAAGAQLTAVLLAALPVGGLGLGYLIGVDPLRILLHTPVGVGCACGAAVLQAAGLAWTRRLQGAPPSRAAAGSGSVRRRLRRLRLRRVPENPSPRTPWLLGLVAGGAVVALLPGVAGVVIGAVVAAVTVAVLRRMEPAAVRAERVQVLADLPWAVDLVGAALRAGAPLDGAVLAVAAALDGPAAVRLQRIGRSLRLGATPAEAWQHLADLPPARRLVAAAERSSASGSALAGALHRCADDLRADAAVRRQAGAQRAGVLIVLPLGLCFLPAFVLAGLVPVVLAVLGEVL
ncbi:hypothetical protein CS0771_16600 [Catellatospora sp. IY07-71]|uniref:type II secretion system F family protein n=1 Tax=Catellatospora sp. IY07-71 TaxID=2728827 RepID=UPI001BB3D4B0|nr:type II secretion system F family protein [Catellatospora sp. IY07-71]BCJ72116.1 hypothetical protein CS0771_16600 [Catellatospora sp. IY07-71]